MERKISKNTMVTFTAYDVKKILTANKSFPVYPTNRKTKTQLQYVGSITNNLAKHNGFASKEAMLVRLSRNLEVKTTKYHSKLTTKVRKVRAKVTDEKRIKQNQIKTAQKVKKDFRKWGNKNPDKRNELRILFNKFRPTKLENLEYEVELRVLNSKNAKKFINGSMIAIDNPEHDALKKRASKPFTLNIFSKIVPGFKLSVNMDSLYHADYWFDYVRVAEERKGDTSGSETADAFKEAQKASGNALDYVTFSITYGGGRNSHGNEKTFKTPSFDIECFSPVDTKNDCGFKVIEYIVYGYTTGSERTGNRLKISYMLERKNLNIFQGEMLTPSNLGYLYKKFNNTGKPLRIVGLDCEEFDLDRYTYILLENEHYFVVKKATFKSHENKKTKRGELYWDIETREDRSKPVFCKGKKIGYTLKDTLTCGYYTDYKTRHAKCNEQTLNGLISKTFSSDIASNILEYCQVTRKIAFETDEDSSSIMKFIIGVPPESNACC